MLKPKEKNNHRSKRRSLVGFVVSGLLVLVSVWLVVNRQYVVDVASVWLYTPSSQIATLADQTGLTDKGKFYFYATQPLLESQADFNSHCPRQEKNSPILGCYTSDSRIYLYGVTNEQLNGIEEVTAAHEVLHAVWARTSTHDRSVLETKLKAAYDKIDDANLKSRMSYYQRTEPGEFTNELHSILGTEFSNLPDELETYYGQFFRRASVLANHSNYSDTYNRLYSRADELNKKMTALAATIQSDQQAYETKASVYAADVASFNKRAAAGQFSSQSTFAAERQALVARLDALNSERDTINTAISTYNTYSKEYSSIASQIEGLNSSIDSFKNIEAPSSV